MLYFAQEPQHVSEIDADNMFAYRVVAAPMVDSDEAEDPAIFRNFDAPFCRFRQCIGLLRQTADTRQPDQGTILRQNGIITPSADSDGFLQVLDHVDGEEPTRKHEVIDVRLVGYPDHH